ncbi:isoamyl acetate-hydrolyzing esterase 1 homolog isoform X2 [Tetranychus urticae]|uniref:SGNH hydrolase-type esterase domain-containing protein n=1 Tax=Tetranychus urticae TaxID=32264 RepID=T1L096_TETUR|nr:isoamyl acetate-hydrolyzing esterase 1 homolog isoform X2 [Tetranychus urticae]
MKWILSLVLVTIVVSRSSRVQAEITSSYDSGNNQNTTWSKVILIGDSITQGAFFADGGCWGTMLANNLQRISDVIARGFSGYTTRSVRAILPDILTKDDYEKAACFVILLGSNDCYDNYIPKEQYKDNLNWIINYIRSQGVSTDKIILMTPPVYHHQDAAKAQGYPPNMAERHPEGFANISRKVAEELQVEVLDLYSITKNHPDSRSLLYDGLHPNKAGAKVIFDSLWPLVYNRIVAFHGSFTQKFPPYYEIEKSLNKDWKN